MKVNNELERKDMVIDRDMEVDCDEGIQITAYIEIIYILLQTKNRTGAYQGYISIIFPK